MFLWVGRRIGGAVERKKTPPHVIQTSSEMTQVFRGLSSLIIEVRSDIDALHDKLETVSKQVEELKNTPVQYVGFADKKELEAHIQSELNETITVMVSEAKKSIRQVETGAEQVLSIVSVGLPT